jgi:hypothetical protein
MKFTSEQLTEALKAKLTPNGKKLAMSERTLKANVERLYKRLEKSDDETELDDVVKEYLPDFEEIDGNVRKDNSDFVNTWKKEHPDTKQDDKRDDKRDDKQGDRLDTLLQEIKELKAEREKDKAEKVAKEKRAELLSMFKEKGIEDEDWAASYLKKLNVNADTDTEAETNDALTLYNKSKSHVDTSGTPRRAGGGATDPKDEFADVVDILKSERRM